MVWNLEHLLLSYLYPTGKNYLNSTNGILAWGYKCKKIVRFNSPPQQKNCQYSLSDPEANSVSLSPKMLVIVPLWLEAGNWNVFLSFWNRYRLVDFLKCGSVCKAAFSEIRHVTKASQKLPSSPYLELLLQSSTCLSPENNPSTFGCEVFRRNGHTVGTDLLLCKHG